MNESTTSTQMNLFDSYIEANSTKILKDAKNL